MERWMKEKASKSLGGASMSKFLEESERKRIARLKNMKSALSKSSYNKHANPWTRNNVEKRHKEIKRKKKKIATNRKKLDETGQAINMPEFQLSNLCDKEVRTKSGLLIPKKRSPARRARTRRMHEDATSKKDNYFTGQAATSPSSFKFDSRAEGKENYSPKSPTNRMAKSRQRPGPSRYKLANVQKQNNSKNKISNKRNSSEGCSIHVISDETKKECKAIEDRKYRQSNKVVSTVVKVGGGAKTLIKKNNDVIKSGMPKSSRVLNSNSNQGAKKRLVANNNKFMSTIRSHIPKKESIQRKKAVYTGSNRGVSMESLSKEKREAMKILNDLDQSQFGAKLSAMKSSMNNLTRIPKNDINRGTKIQVEDFDNCSFGSSTQYIDTDKSSHSLDNHRSLNDGDKKESIVGERIECSSGSSARSDKGGRCIGNINSCDTYSDTFESDEPSSISTKREACNKLQDNLDRKLHLDKGRHQEDDLQVGSSSSSYSSLSYRRFDDEVIVADSNESSKIQENEKMRAFEHDLESTSSVEKNYQADDEAILDTNSFGKDSGTEGNQEVDDEASSSNGSFSKTPTPDNEEYGDETRFEDASNTKDSSPNDQELEDKTSIGGYQYNNEIIPVDQDYIDEVSFDNVSCSKKFAPENQELDERFLDEDDDPDYESRHQVFRNEDSDDEYSRDKESSSTSTSPSVNQELEQPSSPPLYHNTAFKPDENSDSFSSNSLPGSSPAVCGEMKYDHSFESMNDDEKSFRVELWFNNT